MKIAPSILAEYVNDIAFVAEEQPAATTEAFIDQLQTVAGNLSDAGISGAEDLETAATYLTGAMEAPVAEQKTLLSQAGRYLKNIADMVDEYRDMV